MLVCEFTLRLCVSGLMRQPSSSRRVVADLIRLTIQKTAAYRCDECEHADARCSVQGMRERSEDARERGRWIDDVCIRDKFRSMVLDVDAQPSTAQSACRCQMVHVTCTRRREREGRKEKRERAGAGSQVQLTESEKSGVSFRRQRTPRPV